MTAYPPRKLRECLWEIVNIAASTPKDHSREENFDRLSRFEATFHGPDYHSYNDCSHDTLAGPVYKLVSNIAVALPPSNTLPPRLRLGGLRKARSESRLDAAANCLRTRARQQNLEADRTRLRAITTDFAEVTDPETGLVVCFALLFSMFTPAHLILRFVANDRA
jgi:hypothetical protein